MKIIHDNILRFLYVRSAVLPRECKKIKVLPGTEGDTFPWERLRFRILGINVLCLILLLEMFI